MSLGFIMLCHTALDRAAQVARHWAERGCPVVIHIDRKTKDSEAALMQSALQDLPNVRFAPRHICEWGTWGIVAATLEASDIILRDFPDLGHIYLASGSCLPLRPVHELRDYLAARPGTDFIESVTTADVGWTVGGLNTERFTLRFPFSWRRQRKLFDAYVRFQRRIKLKRKPPQGLRPHLGSQWWCLSRESLQAILQAPDRAAMERYFRRVWIPDESFFQSLVRRVSQNVESRSLTLSKFDYQGKPHMFYDDHLQLLRRSDCFVARKIWPQAGRIYKAFLSADADSLPRAEPNPGKIDRLFAKATDRRLRGRPGLYMQSRFPKTERDNSRSAAPYSVFHGFSDLFEDFDTWLSKISGYRVHGHLFARDRVQFSGNAAIFDGALTDHAALRDYNPHSFLTNLIWNTRGERQCFQFGPADRQPIAESIARDPNAQVSIISGAFAIPLFRSGWNFAEIREEAARLQRIESNHLRLMTGSDVKARVRIWSLADYLPHAEENLQQVLDEINPRQLRALSEMPRLRDLSGFGQFLQQLRNEGMQPVLMGDYPVQDQWPELRRSRGINAK